MARRKTAGSAKRVGPKNVKKPKRRPVKKAAKTPKKVKKRRSANRPENKSAKKAEPVVAHHISIQRQFLRPKKERLPSIFHHYPAQIIASVVTLYVIMYLFKRQLGLSFDVVFFSIYAIAMVIVADLFYRHEHKPHDALIIFFLFLLPPLLTAALTGQLWSWVLFGLMLWALLTAIVVHYHHKKGAHLTEVMWVSVYSHLLAFGAALVLFALLSYFRPPVFLTGIQAIAIYLLPPVFIHFFISHYLYVHHFDPKHPVHDVIVGLKYGIGFSILLFIVISALYVGWSVMMLSDASDAQRESLYEDLMWMGETKYAMEHSPLFDLPVYQEVYQYLLEAQQDAILSHEELRAKDIRFADFLTDRSFETRREVASQTFGKRYIDYALVTEIKKYMDEASKQIYTAEDAPYLLERVERPGYSKLKAALYSDELSPQTLVDEVYPATLIMSYGRTMGLEPFEHEHSFIYSRAYVVVQNTVIFRSITRQIFDFGVDLPHSMINNGLWFRLWENRNINESSKSKSLRYGILKTYSGIQKDYVAKGYTW